jgi:pimeloyl-ACP methyl ester carboxylesterase
MGAYEFPDGRLISIRKSEGKNLRYRVYQTGESRRLYRQRRLRYVSGAGFANRTPVQLVVDFKLDDEGFATGLTWSPKDQPSESAERVVRQKWVKFTSGKVMLFGRLDLPEGPGPHPAIVLVHGSGADAATDYFSTCDFYAANGIAALTFDKRGTGRSEGDYTFDFHALAEDVVAAVSWLKTRNEIDPDRIGVTGYSQGGWVGPLAASKTDDIRYVIVNFGMIESPAEEARLETRETLRKRGVDEASLDQVDELTLAGVKVVSEGFREGWDEFDAIKKKYKDAPWMKQLSGTTIGQLVKYPHWLVKLFGPLKSPKHLHWYYDSDQVMDELTIPMVWILGGADESAPNELTIPKLRRYQKEGKPYELVIFPNAAHGMLEFHEKDGTRLYTGYAKGYFTTEVGKARALTGLE